MAIHAETVLSHDDVFAAVIGCDVVQGQCGHAVGLPHFDALVLHQLFALIQETYTCQLEQCASVYLVAGKRFGLVSKQISETLRSVG